MKEFQKVIALALCLVLVMGLFAGCGKKQDAAVADAAPAADKKTEETGEKAVQPDEATVPPVIIACGWGTIGEQELLQQQYYQEVLAPGLNIKFIFSPVLSSDEETVDFLENAAAQGAVGFMDMASSNKDSADIIAEKCDELGIYDASWMPGVATESKYFVGMVTADGQYMATAFYEMLTGDLKDDGETHSMVLLNYGAKNFNPKHLYTSIGALNAFNDIYSLGWSEDDIYSLATTNKRLYVDTGRDDVKICIDPATQNLNETCSELLKGGEYDVLVAPDSFYLQITTAIAEAEQAIGKDVKVYCNSNIVSATQAAFDTKDPYGNASLNQCMLKSSANGVVLMAILLNAVYGDRDAVLTADGNYLLYNIRFMRSSSAEDYARIAKIDHDGNWMFSLDAFKQMLKPFNDQLTSEWLQNYINDNVGFETVMERLGL